MAKVRVIQQANQKSTPLELVQVLSVNFDKYVDNAKIDEETKQKRFSKCSNCEHLTVRSNCRILGTCQSGRKNFFQMHLNRENGGCPTGQW